MHLHVQMRRAVCQRQLWVSCCVIPVRVEDGILFPVPGIALVGGQQSADILYVDTVRLKDNVQLPDEVVQTADRRNVLLVHVASWDVMCHRRSISPIHAGALPARCRADGSPLPLSWAACDRPNLHEPRCSILYKVRSGWAAHSVQSHPHAASSSNCMAC